MASLLQSLSWSRLTLRTKGLIVVALPVVPLAIFWGLIMLTLINQRAPSYSYGFRGSVAVQLKLR